MDNKQPIKEFRKSVEGAIETIQKVVRSGSLYEDGAIILVKKSTLGVTFIEGAPDAIEEMVENACKRDPSFLEIIKNVANKYSLSEEENDKSHDAKIDSNNITDKELDHLIDIMLEKVNNKDDDE